MEHIYTTLLRLSSRTNNSDLENIYVQAHKLLD
jgi:hypothetical protein